MRVRNTRKNGLRQQVGPFRLDEVAQNLSATKMSLGAADDDAPTVMVAAMGGAIVGVVGTFQDDGTVGGIKAGTATLQATVGGTAVGEDCVHTATTDTKVVFFKNRVPFVKGAQLGMKGATSSGFLPDALNNWHAYLVIDWDIVSDKSPIASSTVS